MSFAEATWGSRRNLFCLRRQFHGDGADSEGVPSVSQDWSCNFWNIIIIKHLYYTTGVRMIIKVDRENKTDEDLSPLFSLMIW